MIEKVRTMRLFIGIDLDPNVKNELVFLQEKWLTHASTYHKTSADNLHLTLKFLGDVDASKIDDIMNALDHYLSEFKPFHIKISGIGSFVRQNEHILWAGIEDGKERLQTLYKKITAAIQSIPISTDQTKFNPHITLARKVLFLDDDMHQLPLVSINQKIASIVLFQSHQVNGKLTYTLLDYIHLK